MSQLVSRIRKTVSGAGARLPRKSAKKPAVKHGRMLVAGGVLALVAGAVYGVARWRNQAPADVVENDSPKDEDRQAGEAGTQVDNV